MPDEGSTYTPKVGDLVKVIVEGKVTRDWSHSEGHDKGFYLGDLLLHNSWVRDNVVSIEKLPDPEPEWKHGTVVMAPGHYHRAPIVRDANAGLWRFPDGSESKNHWNLRVSRAWQDGTLKILYTPED